MSDGCAGDAELAEQPLEVRVVAVVEDDEAGVDVYAAASALDADRVRVAAGVGVRLEHGDVVRRLEHVGATSPEMPAPTMAMLGLTTRQFRTSAPFGSRSLPRMRVLVIGDMEGVAGHLPLGSGGRRRRRLRGGPRASTRRRSTRPSRGAFDGGATEVVVMDCHGAGGDRSFNSLIPDALDERCEFVVQTRGPSTPGCSSRAATPPCSSASTRWPAPSAACSRTPCRAPTGTTCASTARGRRGRHQRRAVRDVGLPGRARHRRRRRLRRGDRAARPRPAHARGQAGAWAASRPPPGARPRPAD